MRKTILILAALLAALAAGLVAPAARADCVSDAAVSYVGSDWGPTPMWRVSIPDLHATWDVQAADADAARAAVAPLIACPAVAPVDAPAPAPATAAPAAPAASDGATAAATAILASADVAYVGDSWGPVPIWRVFVPSRNATYDVAATDAQSARDGVLAALATAIDQNPDVVPQASAAAAPQIAALSVGAPVELAAVAALPVAAPQVVAPVKAAPTKTVAKAKAAKHGVHQTPATAKTRP